jgi:hypothetical protein
VQVLQDNCQLQNQHKDKNKTSRQNSNTVGQNQYKPSNGAKPCDKLVPVTTA